MFAEERFPHDRLRIAWLAWKDINLLRRSPFSNLFIKIWINIKNSVAKCFETVNEDFAAICTDFKTFDLTMMQDFPWGYESTSASIVLSVWPLLFAPLRFKGKNWLHPSLSINLPSAILHEHEHFKYLRQHGMIKSTPTQTQSFAQTHRQQMEFLACDREVDFLTRALDVSFNIQSIPLFQVQTWTGFGQVVKIAKKRCRFTQTGFHKIIESFIEQKTEYKKSFLNHKSPSVNSERTKCELTAQLLSLPLKNHSSYNTRVTFHF